MDIRQYFRIFDLDMSATVDEVNEAYKDLVAVWHPDRFPNNPRLRRKAEEKLKFLNDAHEKVLTYLNSLQDFQTRGVTTETRYDDYTLRVKSSSVRPSSVKTEASGRTDPQVRPYVRLLARFVDYFWFYALLRLSGAGELLPEVWFRALVYPPLLAFIWVFPEAVLIRLFGTTPGKWLLKTSVTDHFQLRPKFIIAFKRSLSAWCNGMGMGVAFIAPFTMAAAAFRIKKKGKTVWDSDSGILVRHGKITRLRWGVILLITLILLLFSIINQNDILNTWQQIQLLKPDSPKKYLRLGNLYEKMGRYQEAVETYRKILEIDPDNTQAYRFVGQCYLKLQNYQTALESFKKAAATDFKDAQVFFDLGQCYEKLHLMDEAIKAYRHAIQLDPDFGDVHYHLGRLHFNLQQYEEALEPLRNAARLEPDNIQAHYHLGVCLFRLGQIEKAVKSFEKILQVESEYIQAYHQLGLCQFELGRYHEAIQIFLSVLKINSEDADAYYGLGICYAKLRDTEKAIVALQQAIKNKPDYAQAYHILGLTYLSAGDKESAREQYERLIDMDKDLAKELAEYIENIPGPIKKSAE